MTLKASEQLKEHSEALRAELYSCSKQGTKSIKPARLLELVTPCLNDIAEIEKRKGLAKKAPPVLQECYRKLAEAEVIVHMKPRKKEFPAGYQGLLDAISKVQDIAHKRLNTKFLTQHEAATIEADYAACKQNLEGYIATADLAPLADIARQNIAQARGLLRLLNDDTKKTEMTALIGTLEEKLKAFPATAITKKGSSNVGGNDCFLNACYQFFQVPLLQKHIISNLPKELWEIFATSEPNSALMRKRLVEETPFGPTIRALNIDPYTAQLDSSEVLNNLLCRIYHKNNSYKPPAPSQDAVEVDERNLKKRPGRNKSYLLIYFFIKFFDVLTNSLGYFTRNLFGTEGGRDFHPSLANAMVDPTTIAADRKNIWAGRALLSEERPHEEPHNPLYFQTKLRIEYTPEQDIPDQHASAAEDMWGVTKAGQVGKSEKVEGAPYLALKLAKSGDNYEINEVFREHFNQQDEDDGSTLIRDGAEYKAEMKKTFTLEGSPEGFILSFSRSVINASGRNIKISDPVKGIESTLKVPADLTEDKVEKQYELRSFMSHRGTSATSGHMVAYRKEKVSDDSDEEAWFLFNDGAPVQKVQEADALKAAERSYVLFYRKASS
ncbi:MAG: hypothetical protein S4CHLAM37_10170 [Chlamydiia bacterium]|nr:hypothetical protein [Chlamydiia bacterium]